MVRPLGRVKYDVYVMYDSQSQIYSFDANERLGRIYYVLHSVIRAICIVILPEHNVTDMILPEINVLVNLINSWYKSRMECR